MRLNRLNPLGVVLQPLGLLLVLLLPTTLALSTPGQTPSRLLRTTAAARPASRLSHQLRAPIDRRQESDSTTTAETTAQTTQQTTAETTAETTTAATTTAETATQQTTQQTTQETTAQPTEPTTSPTSAGTTAPETTTATSTGTTTATTAPTTVTTAQSSTATSSESEILVTYTSVVTNSDGTTSTTTGVMQSSTPAPSNSNTGKTWGIVGGVVGGVVLLIAIVFVVWRCTQKRFDSLDDDVEEFKWPELQLDGQTISAQASTLNPLGTRRTGGAGVEMGDHDEGGWGGHSRTESMNTYENLPEGYGHPTDGAGGYYDPYLGPSAAPYPPPHNIYPPPPQDHYTSPYHSNSSLPATPTSSLDILAQDDPFARVQTPKKAYISDAPSYRTFSPPLGGQARSRTPGGSGGSH